VRHDDATVPIVQPELGADHDYLTHLLTYQVTSLPVHAMIRTGQGPWCHCDRDRGQVEERQCRKPEEQVLQAYSFTPYSTSRATTRMVRGWSPLGTLPPIPALVSGPVT
jgi:hypothetical protein